VDVTKECDFLKSVRKEEAKAEVPEKLGYARGKGEDFFPSHISIANEATAFWGVELALLHFFTEKGMWPIKLCQESEEARRGDNDERATAKRHCFPFKEFTK
jgi:hypothetical protein